MFNLKFSFLSIIVTCLLFTNCKKEDIANSSIIERIEYSDDSQNWAEQYFYNSLNQLDSIIGRNEILRFSYNSKGQMTERITYSMFSKNIALRDSFEYDSQNRVVFVKYYSNNGVNMDMIYSCKFTYNSDNKLDSEVKLYKSNSTLIVNYIWKDGNIEKFTELSKDGKIQHEGVLKYDNRNNPFKGSVRYIDYILLQTANNIVTHTGKDFTGLWDPVVNPVIYKYKYNNLDFPSKITNNYPSAKRIFYK